MIYKFPIAKIYQNGIEVAILKKVKLNFKIAPLVPAPFPQPNNEIIEASVKIENIEKSSEFNTDDIVTIKFQSLQGTELIGEFYFNPYKTGNRVYFELTGALTINIDDNTTTKTITGTSAGTKDTD